MIEIFKEFIPGYEVSNYGRVRNMQTMHIWTWQKRHLYPAVHIKGKNYHIHRIVALNFVINTKPDEHTVVNHLDNNYWNPRADNLEWTTTKLNIAHSMKQGRHTSQTSEKAKKTRIQPGVVSKIARKGASGTKGIQIKPRVKAGIKYLVYFNSQTDGAKYLGSFATLEEAKAVYKAAHIEKYGIDPYA